MTNRRLISLALFAAVVAAGPVASAGDIKRQAVHFAKGASSATLKGRIQGDQTIDYTLRARAGQTMNVKLATKHSANHFNLLPPGSEAALFVGSSDGNAWSGPLPSDGEYRVRVYLMRSAARRNEAANYTLTVGVTGGAATSSASAAPAGDAKVAGTPYHATGKVPCSMGDAARGSAQCDFGVIRGKLGQAEVHVTLPGGSKRVLKFGGDSVSAADGAKLKSSKSGDLWSVDVNEQEHYQIPAAVISGG
jgi:hypothetical protein